MNTIAYSKFYNLEGYLFGEVFNRYAKNKTIDALDFFCIVIWKANRAKSKVSKRLCTHTKEDLEFSVTALIKDITEASGNRERFKVLIDTWGFRLPMASAILTVLFPNDFTVYDFRVCAVLGDFQDAQYLKKERLWKRYSDYIERVKSTGVGVNLREKDRWLWGTSFHAQLTKDIKEQFERNADEAELDD